MRDWMFNTGVEVDPDLTPTEKLQLAGLDYEVTTVPAGYLVDGQWFVSNDSYTIRTDNPEVNYGTVSIRKAWNNKEFLTMIESILQPEGYSVTHIGSIDNGGITYYGVELPLTYVNNDQQEETNHYLLITHGHKNGTGVTISKFSNRVYCTNGMNIILRKRKLVTHSTKLSNPIISVIKGTIKQALHIVSEDSEILTALANKHVSYYQVKSHLLELYGKRDINGNLLVNQPKTVSKTIEKIYEIFYAGQYVTKSTDGTAFGLLEAVKQYEIYERGTKKSKEPDNLMKSLLGFSSNPHSRYNRISMFKQYLEKLYLQEKPDSEAIQLELAFV